MQVFRLFGKNVGKAHYVKEVVSPFGETEGLFTERINIYVLPVRILEFDLLHDFYESSFLIAFFAKVRISLSSAYKKGSTCGIKDCSLK